jgi:hypothetical protein
LKFALESNVKPESFNFFDGLFLFFAGLSFISFLGNTIRVFGAAKEASKTYVDLNKLS